MKGDLKRQQPKWLKAEFEYGKKLRLSGKSIRDCKSLINQKFKNDRPYAGVEAKFYKEEVYLPKKIEQDNNDLQLSILKQIKNKTIDIIELANQFDRSPATIKAELEKLKLKGKMINIGSNDKVELLRIPLPSEAITINTEEYFGKKIRFGAIADMHLGSKYQRLDALNTYYDILVKEGIKTVYVAGNIIEGEHHFNKFDILCRGVESQCQYFVDHYPQRKGIITHFITGDDHEGWYTQREQVNVGKIIMLKTHESGRDDIVYIGHMEADIWLKTKKGKSLLRIVHPGGGSTYATSYTAQKLVESYQGGEKPDILLMGHYHKLEYGYPREVHCVQVGCFKDQDPFMRKKKIHAHVGGAIIECNQSPTGEINRFKTEFITFFDKKFYQDKKFDNDCEV